jgi:hypothetical protein
MIEIDFSLLTKAILEQFPDIDCAFAYGSAAFPQKDYDYAKNQPLLDLIFIVNDITEFHQ